MSDAPNGEGDEEPLAGVAAAIEGADAAEADEAWRQLGTGEDAERAWELLAAEEGFEAGDASRYEEVESTVRSNSDRGRAAIPNSVKALHGTITALMFAVSGAVYLIATLGVVEGHLWIVSLPFLALGVVGLLPVVVTWLGVWDPTELDIGQASWSVEDDLPDPESLLE